MDGNPHLTSSDREHSAGSLTRRQTMVWTEQQLAPRVPINNMVMTFELHGALDAARFARAFERLVDEVEVLRTVIVDEDGVPRQRARPRVPKPLEQLDLRDTDDPARVFAARRDQRAAEPLPRAGKLFDALLCRLAEERWAFYFCQHHVICDAWSFSLLWQRLAELYQAPDAATATQALLPYRKYQSVERAYRDSERARRAERFWQAQCALPVERVRFYGAFPATAPCGLRRHSHQLDEATCDAIRALAARSEFREATLPLSQHVLFVTALTAFIHRISGNRAIGIGSPIMNRPSRWAKRTPGLFMEVWPLRVEVGPDDSFATVWQKVARAQREALPHAQHSVANSLRNKRFDAMLNFHNARFGNFAGLPVQSDLRTGLGAWRSPPRPASEPRGDDTLELSEALILHIHDFDGRGRFHLGFDLDRGVFGDSDDDDEGGGARVVQHFLHVLSAMLAEPEQPIGTVALLDRQERSVILGRRGPEAKPEAEGGLLERVHRLAQTDPERPALTVLGEEPDSSLSYGELAVRVARLSRELRRRGIGPEDKVAVCLERSAQLPIALLAVMDAGAAYVPVDPSHPRARIACILEDAKPVLVLTQTRFRRLVADTPAERLLLDRELAAAPRDPGEGKPEPNTNRRSAARPSSLAYVLFTSGSTGRPKGVEIERRSLDNLLASLSRRPGFCSSDRSLAITTVAFDVAMAELFLPLWMGAHLGLGDAELARDPERLAAVIERWGASVVQATPATWQMLVDSGWQGSPRLRAWSGGEALAGELADALCERAAEVWNVYGPTETTVYSAIERVERGARPVAIGRPVARTRLYVLDAAMQPVPDGVVGELFIGGAGVARGYAGRPELTRERFLADPHAPGERIYRTGDLARYLPDGRLQCLGRVDHQVKLRGFRIELGEIESVLRTMPGVSDAVVVLRGTRASEHYLAAYLLRAPGGGPDLARVERALCSRLPSYMVPSAWAVLDAFPMTPNRKIDRAALPDPERRSANSRPPSPLPRDDVEVMLAWHWRAVLGVEQVGREDSFFETGGNSISAVELLSRVRAATGRRVALSAFFRAPTIAGLARALGTAGHKATGSCAVPLRAGGDERPLFCVGGVHLYQDFARAMRPSLPVHGVYLGREVEWMEATARGSAAALPRAELLAADYLAAIRSQQAAGPYRLAGVSYGGVLAYEMAQQLVRAGEQVEALILFDVRLQHRMARRAGSAAVLRYHAFSLLERVQRRRALNGDLADPRRARELLFAQALDDYQRRIAPYPGSALLCRALAEPCAYAGAAPRWGFDGLIDTLELADCRCRHLEIVAFDQARRLRPAIDRYLASP